MTLPARGKITAAKIVLVGVVYNVNIFQEGGPIGLVQNGDKITIDVVKRVIDVELTEAELEERRRKWTPPPHKAARGALWKYTKLVSPASRGCVTDE
jgi:dihydroxy-acid dehydratase